MTSVTESKLFLRSGESTVWSWLAQIGYRRAGWYNVDAINRLAGPDCFYEGKGSAQRIIPELQNIALGDIMALSPGVELKISALEAGRLLVFAGDVPGYQTAGRSFLREKVTDPFSD